MNTIEISLSLKKNKKSNQSSAVRHLFKSLQQPTFITAIPLLTKQLSSITYDSQNNNKNIVVTYNFPYYTSQRNFFLSVKHPNNERKYRFSNLHNLRNSCENSIFCVISFTFSFSCVKKDFSSRASDHRARSAVEVTQKNNKSQKSQRRLSFSCRFVHQNQGMMVWVSDYDKPDTSVNKTLFFCTMKKTQTVKNH